jgi:hypothetical protein
MPSIGSHGSALIARASAAASSAAGFPGMLLTKAVPLGNSSYISLFT